MKRSKAYKMLAEYLNLSSDQCHMKLMDKETAERVVEFATSVHQTLKQQNQKI